VVYSTCRDRVWIGENQDMGVPEPAIVFCLVERILEVVRESGATLEQSTAAVQSVQAVLPVAGLQSRKEITSQCR
jgi:hypothetical protein